MPKILKKLRKCLLSVFIIILCVSLILTGLFVFPKSKRWLRDIHLDIRDRLNSRDGMLFLVDYSVPPWELALEFENVAVLRLVERIPHFSEKQRVEYAFDVVEWIKGGAGETALSVFSSYCSYTHSYSWMEMKLELELDSNSNKLTPGAEYLVAFSTRELGYMLNKDTELNAFTPLSNYVSLNQYWQTFVKVAYPETEDSVPRDVFIACVKNGFSDPDALRIAIEELNK